MKFYLKRIRLNVGGYEYGKYGNYFGTGKPVYRYESEDGEMLNYVRASSRESAKVLVRETLARQYKDIKFFW